VSEGFSLAYGARFLKRVIDDLIKLPISLQWRNGTRFHVQIEDDRVVVRPEGPASASAPSLELAYGT
jgi:hypothetical protein